MYDRIDVIRYEGPINIRIKLYKKFCAVSNKKIIKKIIIKTLKTILLFLKIFNN